MFAPVNSTQILTSSWKKTIWSWGQDQKMIEHVNITPQSRSWANPAWGSWWSITLHFWSFPSGISILFQDLMYILTKFNIFSRPWKPILKINTFSIPRGNPVKCFGQVNKGKVYRATLLIVLLDVAQWEDHVTTVAVETTPRFRGGRRVSADAR